MAKVESTVIDHLDWLGFVQPTGLVVSAHALVTAGAIVDRRDAEGHALLKAAAGVGDSEFEEDPFLRDFEGFARTVLGWNWSPRAYAGSEECPVPEELKLYLNEFGVTLEPTYAVREPDPEEGGSTWQLLVNVVDADTDLDYVVSDKRFEASPHSRLERLLRHTGVTAGLLTNGRTIRLLSAPKGESSGWLDFSVSDMVTPAGRPICAAMRMLLGQRRLLVLRKDSRLAALLAASRKFQNQVSERLAEQVLHALYELLRGIQAADAARGGTLLNDVLERDPNIVYRALLTVLLRLVFLLYAEERDMLPQDEAFLKYYSVAGLHERLREDAALYTDTMSQRFGAWAQLLVLFRMIYDGAETADLDLPPRHGELFDPDRFPFLEGRGSGGQHGTLEVPLVSDGTVFRVLESLLILDGERLSYRTLDVEQIGSVYETLMGFRLETTGGRSIAIRAQARNGAPTVINLEDLLSESPSNREKWLKGRLDRKLTPRVHSSVESAESVADLHALFQDVIDLRATPDIAPPGYLVLQPSEERRRSGSHYTPRELTEPIVRKTLEPILARIAEGQDRGPTAAAILQLKVCDPAMGSGAFLVETCRQLGDALVEAWKAYGQTPSIPPDEDIQIFARRLVAQRCLYGVDRNPVAVDLARVSLWLITLAREHSFTFLDHALRHGDSLVGLNRRQLQVFHWDETQANMAGLEVQAHIERARELRDCIRTASEEVTDEQMRLWWSQANVELEKVRLYGDLVVLAFFEGKNRRDRRAKREAYASAVLAGEAERYLGTLKALREAESPLVPFHWNVEFPEVFERSPAGFDAFVGNPPFMGGRNLSSVAGTNYLSWIIEQHPGSGGGADLVAHFFRKSFDLLRSHGVLGLIATNTISQGDTRAAGLAWIAENGGVLFSARKRVQWPGEAAAVIVSVIHISKGPLRGPYELDGRPVERITAFLFHAGQNSDPARLKANRGLSFQGSIVLGMGFTFDDTDTKGVANPLSRMHAVIAANPDSREVIFPYIGGQEVNTNPGHHPHRYVIDFGERDAIECQTRWPELWAIVEDKVRPERETKDAKKYPRMVFEWWKFWNPRPALAEATNELDRVIAVNCGATPHFALTFLPSKFVFANTLAVMAFDSAAAFAALQSRPHEIWSRFFGSSMKDDLRYTPSDCFETFPFPEQWSSRDDLEAVGKQYYEYRAQLMVESEEGLTKTYNRFHDPNETDPRIVHLRELHTKMDRAVLDAYGWKDVPTDCEFLLDYEIDEETWGDRKKPYRYRWPDEIHDEVLGRLLELNAARSAEEPKPSKSRVPGRGTGAKGPASKQDRMF